jgi:hypothetical protein
VLVRDAAGARIERYTAFTGTLMAKTAVPGALVSLKVGEGRSDSEHRRFAWSAARTYYRDESMPMGDQE